MLHTPIIILLDSAPRCYGGAATAFAQTDGMGEHDGPPPMLVIMPPPDVEKPLLIHRGKQVTVSEEDKGCIC